MNDPQYFTRLFDYGVSGTVLGIMLLAIWRFTSWLLPLLESIAKAYRENLDAVSLATKLQTKLIEQNSQKLDAIYSHGVHLESTLNQHTTTLAEIQKAIAK